MLIPLPLFTPHSNCLSFSLPIPTSFSHVSLSLPPPPQKLRNIPLSFLSLCPSFANFTLLDASFCLPSRMALLVPSPATPSSCTTASTTIGASFYAHIISNSSKGASPPGCLASFLRRILCSHGLHAYSTECSTEEATPGSPESSKHREPAKSIQASDHPSPGIVARLMGLSSMPGTAPTTSPYSEFKILQDQVQGHRKRVDHRSSLQEVPTSVKVETEYIVLSFDGSKKKKVRPCKARKCKGKQDKVVATTAGLVAPGDLALREEDRDEEVVRGGEDLGKKNGVDACSLEKGENECSSENSSPVSVLNFGKFASDRVAASQEEDIELAEPSPRRTSYPEVQDFSNKCMVHEEDSSFRVNGRNCNASEETGFSNWRTCRGYYRLRMCGEIRRLSNAEVVASDWIPATVLHRKELEGISADIEAEIFCHLIEELVASHNASTG